MTCATGLLQVFSGGGDPCEVLYLLVRTLLIQLTGTVVFPRWLRWDFISRIVDLRSCFSVQVHIVCRLHHDQLKPVFHVCRRLRQAVSSTCFLWNLSLPIYCLVFGISWVRVFVCWFAKDLYLTLCLSTVLNSRTLHVCVDHIRTTNVLTRTKNVLVLVRKNITWPQCFNSYHLLDNSQVKIARNWHFNFTTPDHERQRTVGLFTPIRHQDFYFSK